jgi:hypothetical protein
MTGIAASVRSKPESAGGIDRRRLPMGGPSQIIIACCFIIERGY